MDSQLVRGVPNWAQTGSVYINEDTRSNNYIYGFNEVFIGSHNMEKNRLNELLMYIYDHIIPDPNVTQTKSTQQTKHNNIINVLQIGSKYCGRIYTITKESRIYNVDDNMNKVYIGSNYNITNVAIKRIILSILRGESGVSAEIKIHNDNTDKSDILSESIKRNNDDIIKLQDGLNNANNEISNIQEYLLHGNNMDVIASGDDYTTNYINDYTTNDNIDDTTNNADNIIDDIINLQSEINSIRLDISNIGNDRADDANAIASIQADAKRKLDIIYNLNESVKNLTDICNEQSRVIEQLKADMTTHIPDAIERAIALHQKYPNLNIVTSQFEIMDGVVIIH